MTSNYNDSGYSYTNTSGTTSNVPSTDIYNVVNTCGVYFLNGTRDAGLTSIYPIVCSTILDTGMINIDDGYIVYPGYAIQLFYYKTFIEDPNQKSYIYCNYSSRPVLYSLTDSNGNLVYPYDYYNNNSSATASQRVLLQNNTNYIINNTSAIRIWFRGTEVLLTNSTKDSDSIDNQLIIKIFTG
jgi:hypothetical protein